MLIVCAVSSVSLANSGTLVLSGTVPLKAEVVVLSNQVIDKSSSGLKTQIQKRNLASIIQVSAP